MKKTKKIQKLSLKNLKVSVLEARESPQDGGYCIARLNPTCQVGGTKLFVGLDAPPEFQAQTGGLVQPSKVCQYQLAPQPGTSCFG